MHAKTILSGCGGGYDIFGSIPLFFEKENPILVSLSFTKKELLDDNKKIHKITDNLYFVDHTDETYYKESCDNMYFPEYYLSKNLKHGVYLILCDSTINQIIDAYNILLTKHKHIEEIYLIDGGCDVLLSGRETELATPVEDMMHLKAVQNINIKYKYVCAIGLTCDCFSVIKKELINRLDTLGDILIDKKIWSLDDKDVRKYYDIFNKSCPVNSIVHSLICSALEGKTGFYLPDHLTPRIKHNSVELDELMITFFKYDLMKLCKRVIYLDDLDKNYDTDEIDEFIMNFPKE